MATLMRSETLTRSTPQSSSPPASMPLTTGTNAWPLLADNELIGTAPVVIGDRGLKEGVVEYQAAATLKNTV